MIFFQCLESTPRRACGNQKSLCISITEVWGKVIFLEIYFGDLFLTLFFHFSKVSFEDKGLLKITKDGHCTGFHVMFNQNDNTCSEVLDRQITVKLYAKQLKL